MRARIRRDDAGAGLLPSAVGVMVFLGLLLLAVQVVFALYATSTMTAAAWDAARIASGSDAAGEPDRAHEAAEAHLRSVLGAYGNRVSVSWEDDADDVVLRVRADHPTFIPGPLRRPLRLDHVERIVRVRREQVR